MLINQKNSIVKINLLLNYYIKLVLKIKLLKINQILSKKFVRGEYLLQKADNIYNQLILQILRIHHM